MGEDGASSSMLTCALRGAWMHGRRGTDCRPRGNPKIKRFMMGADVGAGRLTMGADLGADGASSSMQSHALCGGMEGVAPIASPTVIPK